MSNLKVDPKKAQGFSIDNKTNIQTSAVCGCFYCLSIFPPSEIVDWIDEPGGGQTALCPKCHIDSVIGSASGFPITIEFLRLMHDHWFAAAPPQGSKEAE